MSKAILDTAEVIHDYMRNGDRSTSREECITWIARLIQEVSQQAPSAEENPQPTDEERKHFAEHNNSRIIKYAEAPSATVDEKTQTIAELIFAVATNADETEDNRIAWIKREMLDTLVVRVKNSQQPTVEVEKIARECVDSLEEAKLLEVSALTERINLSDREDAVRIVSKALTEALRGSYSREEVITIITSVNTELISGRREADDWLTDYDTERGMKNG